MTDREIREGLLEKAIPSDYMRGFYRSINRNFTDFELAAMLWNSRMERSEILGAIKELSDFTADSRLREQIENRLRYEDEVYRLFSTNEAGRYVYTVEYEDKEWPCGYFKALDQAIAYAKRDGKRKFEIAKQIIVEDELPMRKENGWNPNLFPEKQGELQEYCGAPEGKTYYSANGEILYLWSDNLPEEVENLADKWSSERFENYPMILETPFDRGDIVMDEDQIGVIDITKGEMENFHEKVRSGKIYCDYSDTTATTVQYIGTDGRIGHNHPSLLFLRKVNKEELPPELREYVGVVSDMVQRKYPLDFFLFVYEEKIKGGNVWD